MFNLKEIIESKLPKGIEITIPIIKSSQKSESKIKQLAENSTKKAIRKFKNKGDKKDGLVKKSTD